MNIVKIKILVILFGAAVLILSAATVTYPENLFDDRVLRHYGISWLVSPPNAEEELFILSGKGRDPVHEYKCKIQSEQRFKEYAEFVFSRLNGRDYIVARFLKKSVTNGIVYYREWAEVVKGESAEEYKSLSDNNVGAYGYEFYFTTRGLGEYEDGYHGSKMKKVCRIILQYCAACADGYNFYMKVGYDCEAYYITDEKYLEKLLNPYPL